jgi:flagellar biosynthesis GTPase FlhF
MASFFSKIKWITVIIIIIIALYVIIKCFKLKPELEDMLRKESKIARTVFSARDIIHSTSSTESSVPSSKSSKSPNYRRKFKTEKEKLEKEEELEKEEQNEEEENSEEEFERKVKSQRENNRSKPRRSNSKVSTYKREEFCRKIFEEHFDDYFPTVRPKFLKNPKTGRPLELDGYNSRLSLAFEHQGKQHYIFPNRFHKTEKEYLDQLERDVFKLNRCRELGIDLILIHEDVPQNQIKDFIMLELRKIKK